MTEREGNYCSWCEVQNANCIIIQRTSPRGQSEGLEQTYNVFWCCWGGRADSVFGKWGVMGPQTWHKRDLQLLPEHGEHPHRKYTSLYYRNRCRNVLCMHYGTIISVVMIMDILLRAQFSWKWHAVIIYSALCCSKLIFQVFWSQMIALWGTDIILNVYFHIFMRHTVFECDYTNSNFQFLTYSKATKILVLVKYRFQHSLQFGVMWIIVMFLSAVWTLILTAPIHCGGPIAEQVM